MHILIFKVKYSVKYTLLGYDRYVRLNIKHNGVEVNLYASTYDSALAAFTTCKGRCEKRLLFHMFLLFILKFDSNGTLYGYTIMYNLLQVTSNTANQTLSVHTFASQKTAKHATHFTLRAHP